MLISIHNTFRKCCEKKIMRICIYTTFKHFLTNFFRPPEAERFEIFCQKELLPAPLFILLIPTRLFA